MRILIATDGSECSEYAVNEIARRPWPAGSEFRIVLAVDAYPAGATEVWAVTPSAYMDLESALRERGVEVLQAATKTLEDAGIEARQVTLEVLTGAPKRAILEEAERWRADLVVVGSHGYGAVARIFLGSVSHAVATHAHCSVEIVRRRPSDA
jgi:nucleotide-binding universal stress UspA family protein